MIINKIKPIVHIKKCMENISSYNPLGYTKFFSSCINEFSYYRRMESKVNDSTSEHDKIVNRYMYYKFEFKNTMDSVLSSLYGDSVYRGMYTIRLSPNGVLGGNQYEYGNFIKYRVSHRSKGKENFTEIFFVRNNIHPMPTGKYSDN